MAISSDKVAIYKTSKQAINPAAMLVGLTTIRTAAYIYRLNASQIVEHFNEAPSIPFWWQDALYRYELRRN